MNSFIKKLWLSTFGGEGSQDETVDTSPRGKVDTTDMAKVVRNILLASVAAALTYAIEDPVVLAKFGPMTVVVITGVLDFIKKLNKKN